MRIEIAQLVVIDQLPGIGGPDTDIRLDDHGIPDLRDKLLGGIKCGNRMLAGSRDLVLQVNLFHQGFFLDEIDLIDLISLQIHIRHIKTPIFLIYTDSITIPAQSQTHDQSVI